MMRTWFLLGMLLSVPWLALVTAGQYIFGLPLPPVTFFELLIRWLPGPLVTVAIDLLIALLRALQLGPTARLAKFAEFGLAYLIAGGLIGALGGILGVVLSRSRLSWQAQGSLAGLVLGFAVTILTAWKGWKIPDAIVGAPWLLALSLGWGLALSWTSTIPEKSSPVRTSSSDSTQQSSLNTTRRRTLAWLAFGSLSLAGVVLSLARLFARQPAKVPTSPLVNGPTSTPVMPARQTPVSTDTPLNAISATPETHADLPIAAPVEPRPEITPLPEFYRVDINLLPPGMEDFTRESDRLAQRLRAQGGDTSMDKEGYYLTISGMVNNPLSLSLADLKAFPAVEQYATLSCISNPVAGDLISTNKFTGARLGEILTSAGILSGALDLKFTCVDGYTESLPVAVAQDPRTLLCYALGGQPLTQEHGAPIRLFVPDRFGMKNPKWVLKIEAVAEDYRGYWEQRGWDEDAFVQLTSVIDAIGPASHKQAQAAGIAYAGARQVSRVEIRVDEGDWQPAELKQPLSPLSWVIWRSVFDVSPGLHQLTVRAYDGTGKPQVEEISGAHPTGATGYHIRAFQI
jgi:DMSO/TMAO reductase YedYZ molybdopterin-dependent catalytic subunit